MQNKMETSDKQAQVNRNKTDEQDEKEPVQQKGEGELPGDEKALCCRDELQTASDLQTGSIGKVGEAQFDASFSQEAVRGEKPDFSVESVSEKNEGTFQDKSDVSGNKTKKANSDVDLKLEMQNEEGHAKRLEKEMTKSEEEEVVEEIHVVLEMEFEEGNKDRDGPVGEDLVHGDCEETDIKVNEKNELTGLTEDAQASKEISIVKDNRKTDVGNKGEIEINENKNTNVEEEVQVTAKGKTAAIMRKHELPERTLTSNNSGHAKNTQMIVEEKDVPEHGEGKEQLFSVIGEEQDSSPIEQCEHTEKDKEEVTFLSDLSDAGNVTSTSSEQEPTDQGAGWTVGEKEEPVDKDRENYYITIDPLFHDEGVDVNKSESLETDKAPDHSEINMEDGDDGKPYGDEKSSSEVCPECDLCDARFADTATLFLHMNAVHGMEVQSGLKESDGQDHAYSCGPQDSGERFNASGSHAAEKTEVAMLDVAFSEAVQKINSKLKKKSISTKEYGDAAKKPKVVAKRGTNMNDASSDAKKNGISTNMKIKIDSGKEQKGDSKKVNAVASEDIKDEKKVPGDKEGLTRKAIKRKQASGPAQSTKEVRKVDGNASPSESKKMKLLSSSKERQNSAVKKPEEKVKKTGISTREKQNMTMNKTVVVVKKTGLKQFYEKNLGSPPDTDKVKHEAKTEPLVKIVVKKSAAPKSDEPGWVDPPEKTCRCTICNKMYKSTSDLRGHIMVEHTNKRNPVQCFMCGMVFSKNAYLKRHIRKHTGEKPYKCDHCEKGFSQAGHLKRHKLLHTGEQPYACDKCDKKFTDRGMLKLHTDRYHSGEAKFVCTQCDSSFHSKMDLRRHMNEHYTITLKPNMCIVCGLKCPDASVLTTHLKSHKHDHTLSCIVCQKTFRALYYLERHGTTHSDYKPYRCKLCEATFAQREHILRHMRRHAGREPLECPVCLPGSSRQYTNPLSLRKHVLKEHPNNKDCLDQLSSEDSKSQNDLAQNWEYIGMEPYKCDQCDAAFTMETSYKSHMRTHKDFMPWTCEYCGKGFIHKSRLESHLQSHTMVVKRHKCEYCGKAFAYETLMTAHLREHTGEKPYLCTDCGESFTQSRHLTMHIRNVHRPDLKPMCTFCRKQFTHQHSLKIHIRTHTGEKPHKCSICGEAFKHRRSCTTHELKHSGEKAYYCSICGGSFTERHSLKMHMIRQHGMRNVELQRRSKPKTKNSIESLQTESDSLEIVESSDSTHYECSRCEKDFPTLALAEAHTVMHMAGTMMICSICRQIFMDEDKFRSHTCEEYVQQPGDKSYMCNYCNLGFTSLSSFQSHMCVHSVAQIVVISPHHSTT